MKIDIVYLWVDGSDKEWQAKKDVALAQIGRPNKKSSVAAHRWQDNNELKYSLRSVEKFAPWINHIYIVTDNQKPKWLADHPKVSIIDHKEVMPAKYLPAFNSVQIEFNIYNIPNLSEHFIYANDDMFFGQPVSKDFFFDIAGNPIVIMKRRNNRRTFKNQASWGNWKNTKKNALRLVLEKFGIKYNVSFKHAIEPFRKSYMKEIAEKFHDEIVVPTMTPFRAKSNVQRMVFPMIDNALGRNRIVLNWRDGAERIDYKARSDSWLYRIWYSLRWFTATVFGYIKYDCFDKQTGIIYWVRKYKPLMFAINDSSGKHNKFSKAGKLMYEMFPNKSQFEK